MRRILAALVIAAALFSGAIAPQALAAVHTHGHITLDHTTLYQSDAGFLDDSMGAVIDGYTSQGWYCIVPQYWPDHSYVVFGPVQYQLTNADCQAY